MILRDSYRGPGFRRSMHDPGRVITAYALPESGLFALRLGQTVVGITEIAAQLKPLDRMVNGGTLHKRVRNLYTHDGK